MTIVGNWRRPDHPDLTTLENPTLLRPDAKTAALLLHGFTGTPFEMKSLVGPLASRGVSVVVPALRGHATHPSALRGVTWHDWLAGARAEAQRLRSAHERVVVIGLSMGAVLARLLLADEPPDAAVMMGIPYRVLDRTGRWLLPLMRVLPVKRAFTWLKDGGSDIADKSERDRPCNYRWTPLEALCELDALLRAARRQAAGAPCPVLMLHGRKDHTAPIEGARAVRTELGAKARLAVLPRSYHVLPRDVEREPLARVIADFATHGDLDRLQIPADWVWDA